MLPPSDLFRKRNIDPKTFFIASLLAVGGAAHAVTADFDDLTEGWAGLMVVDHGIAFNNLETRNPGTTPQFAIDDASTSAHAAFISAPNVLGFSGWEGGGNAGFGRFYSMDFGTGSQASSVSMLVGSVFADPGAFITLQGILNGVVVATDSYMLTESDEAAEFGTLSLAPGLYDSFHLVSSNAMNDGAVGLDVDNVTITPVPEPATLTALGLGAAVLRRRRNRD